MTLHQPMYNLDQQVLHELYLTWILAGAFILLCVATLLVISRVIMSGAIRKTVKHIKAWNKWRKVCTYTKTYKLLVLLKIAYSPSLPFFYFTVSIENLIKNYKGVKLTQK